MKKKRVYKNKIFRNYEDPQYKRWRQSVYKRDKYKCQWPKCNKNKNLRAHHIKTWAQYPSLRFEINNGITLCPYHHRCVRKKEDEFVKFFLDILRRKGV